MMPAVQITTSVNKYLLRFAELEFAISVFFISGSADNKVIRSDYV